MNVNVDQTLCIGCSLCVKICPDCFRMGTNGLAEAYQPCLPELCGPVNEAVESCPIGAIRPEIL